MNKLLNQLEEDRALRNEARDLFRNDLTRVRHEVSPGAIGERIARRVGAKADNASDAAIGLVERHGRTAAAGALGALAAGAIWLVRKPILSGLARLAGKDEDDEAGNGGGKPSGEDSDNE